MEKKQSDTHYCSKQSIFIYLNTYLEGIFKDKPKGAARFAETNRTWADPSQKQKPKRPNKNLYSESYFAFHENVIEKWLWRGAVA